MMRFIYADPLAPKPGSKTHRWAIRNRRSDDALGAVGWYGAWRQYSFTPLPNTIYSDECLRDIAAFCAEQTQAQLAAPADGRVTSATMKTSE